MGPVDFAHWLVRQRERLKAQGQIATQAEIAQRSGVSRSMIATIEGMTQPNPRIVEPSRDTVEKLARAVKGSKFEALAIAGYAPADMQDTDDYPGVVKEIADSLVSLSAEDQMMVYGLVGRLAAAGHRNPPFGPGGYGVAPYLPG